MSKSLCDCQLGSQASVIIAPIFRCKNRNLQEKGNAEDITMSTTNFSSSRSHTKSFEELLCSPSSVGGLRLQQQQLICFSAVDILLSITAFAGNSPILVALYKESSLHPPSKHLYCSLATTDLLVGLVAQPLYGTC